MFLWKLVNDNLPKFIYNDAQIIERVWFAYSNSVVKQNIGRNKTECNWEKEINGN